MERRVRADLATAFLPALMICPTAFPPHGWAVPGTRKHRLRSRRRKKTCAANSPRNITLSEKFSNN